MATIRRGLTPKDQLLATIEHLEDTVQELLANSLGREDITGSDRAFVESLPSALRERLAQFNRALERSRLADDVETDVNIAAYKMMANAFLVGQATGLMSKQSEDWRKSVDAWKMRRARANSPEEVALKAAIVEQRGSGPAPHPTKEAESILTEVNFRLELAGFPAVSRDQVRRRLEKFPRS